MAKKGMKRPEWTHTKPKNDVSPVPELQGKAKSGKEKANPIVSGTMGGNLKVYHTENRFLQISILQLIPTLGGIM